MLVFKCKCGGACSAPDHSAGGKIVCPQCQDEILVPHTSAEDCVIIFRNGDPDTGQPLTLLELQAKINSGELSSFDLIWQGENWLPLGKIYDLPPPPEAEIDDSLQELALDFEDLPAVAGFPNLPRRKKKKKAAKRKGRSSKAAPGAPLSARQKIWQILRLAAVLAILAWGGIRGGRVLNFILKKPSYILVINTFERDFRAKIMNYDWQECIRGGNTLFADVFVAMPCRKKMRFEPLLLGSGGLPQAAAPAATDSEPAAPLSPTSLRIPVRPSCDTIVNPGGRGIFGVYDFSKLPELSLQTPELGNLSREIAEGREPISASRVCQQMQELGKTVFVEKRQDEFFTSRDFQTSKLGINRTFNPAAAENAAAVEVILPPYTLTYPLRQNLNFKNGTLTFDPEDERTERTIMLTSKEFKPASGYLVTSGSPRLTLRPEPNGLRLTMTGLKGKVLDQKKKSHDADWSYDARLQAGRWNCKWIAKYRLPTGDKSKSEEIVLTFPPAKAQK